MNYSFIKILQVSNRSVLQWISHGDVCRLPNIPCDNWKRERCMNARYCQTQTGRLKTSEEFELIPVRSTTMTMMIQGCDIPSWMFEEELNREETKKTAPKKGS